MITTRFKGSLLILVGVICGILLTTVISAVLAHGGDETMIHACVKNNNGNVRIVDANESCKNNETPLDWSRVVSDGGTDGLLENVCTECNFSVDAVGDLLEGEDLTGYVLSFSDFSFANLVDTNFAAAMLNGASFQSANIVNANFSNAQVRRATFGTNTDMTNVNFTDADLSETDINTVVFTGANLTNANLTATKLDTLSATNVNFQNANVDQTRFRQMSLVGSLNLSTAANLATAIWDDVVCPDGTNSIANGDTCLGHLE